MYRCNVDDFQRREKINCFMARVVTSSSALRLTKAHDREDIVVFREHIVLAGLLEEFQWHFSSIFFTCLDFSNISLRSLEFTIFLLFFTLLQHFTSKLRD